MKRVAIDEERERRIDNEVIVDAYDEIEMAMGWYYYLEGKISFPFDAICSVKKRTSPLKIDETVSVIKMSPETECEHSMFVETEWDDDFLDIPLEQIEPIDVDEETQEAVEDWHYWLARGRQL